MGYVVALLNQKGGVAKTSTCYHLAGTLAKAGGRVLLIDNDPQASLTRGFWGPQATLAIDPAETVAALFDPDILAIPSALIHPTGFDGISIVPGSIALTEANMRPPTEWVEAEGGIRGLVDEVRDSFDIALIDCPPNLHLCSWAALAAADGIVVPLQAEDFGSQGLAPVQEAIKAIQDGPNPALRLVGYLLTMFDKRLTVHMAYSAMLREMYGADVFEHPVPRVKDFIEAVAARKPISHYKARGAAVSAMKDVADELAARIGIGRAIESERGAA